jgi:ribosomal protein L11 methyltransferase
MRLAHKTVLAFSSEEESSRASAILSETPGWEDFPLVLSEDQGRWMLECYDNGALAGEQRESVISVLDAAGIALTAAPRIETLPDADWVSLTQKALPPVRAGRFVVHGSHDRQSIFSQWAIEIDAGRAFGTAHHGTTLGCLLAIESTCAKIHPHHALDLGTGSGVLAIATVKATAYRCRVAAVDIDPVAIEVARQNCLKNGVAANVTLHTGNGATPAAAYRDSPYDLITANILARPLLQLAPRVRSLLRPGGVAILSGLLNEQEREVLGRYQSLGFRAIEKTHIEGWSTLQLLRSA